jgi:hypothetical protein
MEKMNDMDKDIETKLGWRPRKWARVVLLSKSQTYRLISEGKLQGPAERIIAEHRDGTRGLFSIAAGGTLMAVGMAFSTPDTRARDRA